MRCHSMNGKADTSKHKSSELKWIPGGALVSVWFGVIVALALLLLPRFKAWALPLDPALLTALQGWRV